MSIPLNEAPSASTHIPSPSGTADSKQNLAGRTITWFKDINYKDLFNSSMSMMLQTAKVVLSIAFASLSMINSPLTFLGALVGGVLLADKINASLDAVTTAVMQKAIFPEKLAFCAALFFATPLALSPQFRAASFGLYYGAQVAARALPAADKSVKV